MRRKSQSSKMTIPRLPFVGETSLEALQANLSMYKVNSPNLLVREHHQCTPEDVQGLVREAREHVWISLTQQG
jgi:hypothetical protein